MAISDAEEPTPLRFVQPPQATKKLLSDGQLGMLFFLVTEVMLFAAFISAFVIVKSAAVGGVWPPPDQPRLPVGATALNSLVLLTSGVLIFAAHRRFKVEPKSCIGLFRAGILCGIFFVLFQGYEWVVLLAQGLTIVSSQMGSFFYMIVGLHALHAVAAIGIMVWLYRQLTQDKLTESAFLTGQLFWYFVVLLWPVLYVQVYL
jgi:cytochrome c oxidase subunit 3